MPSPPPRFSCSTNSGASLPGIPADARPCCEALCSSGSLPGNSISRMSMPPIWKPSAVRYRDLIDDGGLDLAVLGLGMNGHLGLNEPGSGAHQPTRVVELTAETREGARRYGANPPPTWGLAVGLAEILAAREVWLLVTGPTKAEVLDRVINGPVTRSSSRRLSSGLIPTRSSGRTRKPGHCCSTRQPACRVGNKQCSEFVVTDPVRIQHLRIPRGQVGEAR